MKHPQSPWWWVPTLYFAEGIPYFIVNNISVTMFTKMGVPNGEMALFTSLLYLPWTIKPMQLLMSAAFVLLTLTIPHPSAAVIASGHTPINLFTITLLLFIITAFASATHDIAADGFYMLALSEDKQSFFVGIRSTFYRLSSIFGQGVLVYIAGSLEKSSGNIPMSWQVTMGITAALFTAISLYHTFALPKPGRDAQRTADGKPQTFGEVLSEFGHTFYTYFHKPGVWLAIVFMLLYRLPEAFLLKMVNPFLLGTTATGGLALDTDTVGIVYGTIGVIALTVGGIIGGIAASRWGLKKALWPMAASMTLPCATFVYLSICLPHDLVVISTCVAVEQFGYGFGFTAYMLYMMHFSEGKYVTAHYAICTAFMALSMMLPMACCLATVVMTMLVRRKIEPEYGKKH